MSRAFAHVICAIATPFRSQLSVDHEALLAHVRWLTARGCDGILLFGTTGEAASLTVAERRETLTRLIASGVSPDVLMVGTGCCALADTVELTRHAAKAGVRGALVLPPFFFKGVSDDGVANHYEALIEACAADLPPLYLYNIPQVSGVAISPDLVAQLVAEHGGKIVGYKDSAGDWSHSKALIERFPQLDIYVGSEVFLLDTLRIGGAGTISAEINLQPRVVRDVYDHRDDGDAQQAQERATAVRRAMEKAGPLISASKAMLARINNAPDWVRPRPPLVALSAAKTETLRRDLRALDVEGV